MKPKYQFELTGPGFELKRELDEELSFEIVSLLMAKSQAPEFDRKRIHRLRYFRYQILAMFELLSKSKKGLVLGIADLRHGFEQLKLNQPANWSQQIRRMEKDGWISRRSGGIFVTASGWAAFQEWKQQRLLDHRTSALK